MFVVWLVVLPTAEEDEPLFEGQGPDDDLVSGVGGPTHFQVRLGPNREFRGTASELVKGLTQELGACPADLQHLRLAAAAGDGRDAAHLLDVMSALKLLAVGAEGGGQPRSKGGTRTWKRGENIAVWVFGKQGGDLLVALGDGPVSPAAQEDCFRHVKY